MAPKASSRSKKRTSSAHIAQARVGRGRGRANGKRSRKRASTRHAPPRRRSSDYDDEPRRRSFLRTPLLAIIMAGLGFGLVYYWDAAGHKRPPREAPAAVSSSSHDDGPTLSDLYHKLVDRFWDRDMPTKKRKSKPLLPKAKAKKVAAQKPAPTNDKRAEEKPPTRYRQQSEGLPVAKMRREQKKRNQRQRIEAILDTVGVQ